jgi:hypothetical protein
LVIELDEASAPEKPVMHIDFSDEAEQPTMPPQGIKNISGANTTPAHKTPRS